MMLLLHKQKRCQAGYTLVELMVAVALTGIVTMSIYKSYISVSTSYDVQDQVVEVQQNARVAMDRMVREIRLAGCDPQLSDVPTFLQVDDSTVRFTMDIAGGGSKTDHLDNDIDGFVDEDDEAYMSDGDVDDAGEDITYSLVGEELKRTSTAGGTAQVVIENVNALRFIYYDKDYAITADPAKVRIVQIAVVVRSSNEDYAFTDNTLYNIKDLTAAEATVDIFNAAALPAAQKNFRRQLLTAVVRCRNMSMATVD